jgi:hypothetical protein
MGDSLGLRVVETLFELEGFRASQTTPCRHSPPLKGRKKLYRVEMFDSKALPVAMHVDVTLEGVSGDVGG